MRYERLKDIIRLAIRLQGSRGGVTLDDIKADFGVSRRTAERLRDTVEWAFGPLDIVPRDDNKRHWRLRSDALRRLVAVSVEELAELAGAADVLERTGLDARAEILREIARKLRATLRSDTLDRIEADVEALIFAEGLAMRPGPRPRLDAGLLSLLREAVVTGRVVKFRYFAQATGRRSRQSVQPYGLIHGNRAFLVGRTDWADEPRLWRLANMSDARITEERFDRDPAFDLRAYAKRSFGTFQEKPVEVVLCFLPRVARDAAAFLFHPDQTVETNGDGSVTVRFTAGGIDEMCWHLVTWGDSVIVEKPVRLRERLATMCQSLALHHGSASAVGHETRDSRQV
ncbi:MAG: WYL domain-containing protein [bacterium]|nr:WYL domain-containing protein [bacterium]